MSKEKIVINHYLLTHTVALVLNMWSSLFQIYTNTYWVFQINESSEQLMFHLDLCSCNFNVKLSSGYYYEMIFLQPFRDFFC